MAPGPQKRTVRTTCKIGACEPFCGLEVDVEGGHMVAVRPDPAHPISHGYACLKGMAVPAYQNDPDRLVRPERRITGGFADVPWDEAIADIGARLKRIRAEHGPTSIATYWGNAADSVSITLANTFCHSFGSPNSFNVLSLEYTDRGAVAARMFGNENFILQPDAGRSSYALLIGTNPIVTQGMTLLQRRPRIAADFKAVQRRGGKIVVVDPRRTESVRLADEHVAILPGTDLFFLLGLLRRIFDRGAVNAQFVATHCSGLRELEAALAGVDLATVARVTGLAREQIERIADEFAAAPSAFASTRVGVQTSWNTTLTEWAVQCLNAVTGNIDRPGGVYFNPGAIDVPALIAQFTKRRNDAPSRVGGYPQIFGGPPASVFADDVLSDAPDRIRALVVVAGNPVITFPNTKKIEKALKRLDLLVCIDIYRSDTGAFAHYNLPAATMYEKGTFHFLTSTFEPYPFAEWKPKVVEATGEARSEWHIFKDLARAAGVPFLNDPALSVLDRLLRAFGGGMSEKMLFRYLLRGKTSLRRLENTPGGVTFGAIEWGRFLSATLQTQDGRIALGSPDLLAALPEVWKETPHRTPEFPMLLISGARRSASYNTWTHNLPELAADLRGNWATLAPADATTLGVVEGGVVRIETESGSLAIAVRISPDIRDGVVSVHQFWGHKYDSGTRTSRATPGVNVNLVHDDRTLDRFTGMPVFNGRRCRVAPA